MTGLVKVVIFDWAGTMVDFGCLAPVRALQAVLLDQGVEVSEADVRLDMGMAKRDHIARLLEMPRQREAWLSRHAEAPGEAEIDRLHSAVEPLMIAAAGECAQLIPGAREAFEALLAAGVRVGSGTGYTRAMMQAILPKAAAQGYRPEVVICAGETARGRPSAEPMLRALSDMGVTAPITACVKVDDAPVGIAEGRAAGAWTIGVAASGNAMGLGLEAYLALSQPERARRLADARASLQAAKPDYVIDSVADLAPALAQIEARIAAGERPSV
ncbi:phosphonoacetaldehyde hydrolase [Phenylobacterium sp.]|jgi:phosphonoacetaldehyde hydrolase|uniref:phosphonoacetaldehyde hydrolase n=1 Tax=Phenylobacterium sp. TaxID=1871053 RepID=UPI0037C74BC3